MVPLVTDMNSSSEEEVLASYSEMKNLKRPPPSNSEDERPLAGAKRTKRKRIQRPSKKRSSTSKYAVKQVCYIFHMGNLTDC